MKEYDTLDLQSKIASWDEESDRLLINGSPFTGWAIDKFDDGRIQSRTFYSDGFPNGRSEEFYENGKRMNAMGLYLEDGTGPLNRAWSEEGILVSEELNIGSIRCHSYKKYWSLTGNLEYHYDSPATYQSFKHGIEEWWHPNGTLQKQILWKLGINCEEKEGDVDGKLLLTQELIPNSSDTKTLHERELFEEDMRLKYGPLD